MAKPSYAYFSAFSGIGGWDYGAYLAGARFDEHYFSEVDPFAIKVFQQRFPDAIALGDITKLNESHFQGNKQYIFSGSFPCTDLSLAGKRAGLKGKNSGLWFEFLRLIRICKPAVVLVENVGVLATSGLDVVVAGLWSAGYNCCWRVISAADVGAPHLRERLWVIAFPRSMVFDRFPLSFKLKRRMCAETGCSVMILEDVRYEEEAYYVGSCESGGVFCQCQSIGRDMPKGGFSVEGVVSAIPAWEGGLEVNEVLENANDNIGRVDEKGDCGEGCDGGREAVRSALSVNITRAGAGHEALADSDSSRWEGHSFLETELEADGGPLHRHSRYSELEGGWDVKPGVQQLVNGVPWYIGSRGEVPFPVSFEKGVDDNKRLSCYGNALLPQIAWIMFRRIKPIIPDCFIG